jgi:hypothetical protein
MGFESFQKFERFVPRFEAVKALSKSDDPGSCETYLLWRDQEERKVRTQEDGLHMVLGDASVRKEAGLTEATRDAYEEARLQAYQMYQDDIIAKIDALLSEL